MLTVEKLCAFEKSIVDCFENKLIHAPVHLAGGNEAILIDIFKRIRPQDWVCGAWRMHYHCLLKGVPPERLKADIIAGKSITLCYPEFRIITSAIAGGIVPIATGIAEGIKKCGGDERVWCFIGDMTVRMGVVEECRSYANGHNLPITFVVEDNGLSVCTETEETWFSDLDGPFLSHIETYRYKMTRPHQGIGKRISF